MERIDFLVKNKITDYMYYYKLYDFCNDPYYHSNIKEVHEDKKMAFRYFCYRYIDETRKFQMPSISIPVSIPVSPPVSIPIFSRHAYDAVTSVEEKIVKRGLYNSMFL